jgi:leucyl-tRNA synthetase
VNPDEYIDRWGADTFRTYLVFLGPYEEGGDFRDAGLNGVRRFLERLWLSVHEARRDGSADPDVMRKVQRTIKKVGEDIPKLSYNTAIAAMMECINALRSGERTPHIDEVCALVQLVSPFAPHVAEELWETLGGKTSVFDTAWPTYDAAMIADDTIEMPVQVNGKRRGAIVVRRDVAQAEALSLAMRDAGIAKFVTGEPKKVILVPGRLLNLVI